MDNFSSLMDRFKMGKFSSQMDAHYRFNVRYIIQVNHGYSH